MFLKNHPMRIRFTATLLLLLSPVLLSAQDVSAPAPSPDARVRKANYALAERFSAPKVDKMVYSTRITPHWFAGDDRFWYEWKTSEGTRYYIVDPATGAKTEVFDMEKLAMQLTAIVRDPFDAQHIPLRNLRLKDDKLFTFDITSSQDKVEKPDTTGTKKPGKPGKGTRKKEFHFEYDFASRTLRDVTEERGDDPAEKYPHWAAVSPDGSVGVYLKDHDLWWMDAENLRKAVKDDKDSTLVEHRITTDGTRDFSWGGGNYTGDTEADSTKRGIASVCWAPDGKHLATVKWDMSVVKEYWVINALSSPRPTLETYHYQMPGEPGPKGTLYVFDTSSWTAKPYGTAAFKDQDMDLLSVPVTAKERAADYVSRKWLGDAEGFYLVRQSRDLKRMDLCRVDLGADSAHTVVAERMNTYVETRRPKFLKDGKRFIHWSERNGWANLYLYGADGTLVRNLTEGAFHVEDVLAVNEEAGYVLFSACGFVPDENPYQMHTFKVPLSGGTPVKLDMDDMDVLSTASDDGRYFIANYSRVDCKPAVALYDARAGKKVRELEEADFSSLLAAGYRFPERFKVKAADGITDLYGAMYKPFDFDSTKVYPICDYVYPGPQVEANNISWSKGFTRTDRLAQLGLIVITVGNRGGHPNRSKWYHNYGYGNLRDYGLEDQKYAIQQLAARYPFIDPDRVGIHGHSGGGFMSTAAILKYPDFFKVAVSCAGNHDNSIYNRWWSEQHHGILEKVDKGDTTFVYHIDTNQELARNLKGHLMLVHGDIDNNVHPANTIRVVNALIRANKRFDMLLLPGQRHGFGDMNEYFFWRMADYYAEWLLGDTQRSKVDVTQLNNE